MKHVRDGIDKILKFVCSAIMGVMAILVVYQVVARYFFRAPSTFSEELMTYLFIWMSLLGGTYVYGKSEHMSMSFLYNKFPAKLQKVVDYLIQGIGFVFGAALLYGGASIVRLTMNQQTPALGVPMGYLYMVLPVCGVGILAYSIMNLCEMMKESRG